MTELVSAFSTLLDLLGVEWRYALLVAGCAAGIIWDQRRRETRLEDQRRREIEQYIKFAEKISEKYDGLVREILMSTRGK